MLDRKRSALVLVDYQSRLMHEIEAGESAPQEAVFLARVAQELGVPVLGTEQNPDGLGANDERVRSLCERTIAKMHFNATADGLAEHLGTLHRKIEQVVLAGCETHVCLLQTALGLLQQGLRVFVTPRACASRRADDKALALQRMVQSGATLVSGEMVAFEWLHSCTHPGFKKVLELVKGRSAV